MQADLAYTPERTTLTASADANPLAASSDFASVMQKIIMEQYERKKKLQQMQDADAMTMRGNGPAAGSVGVPGAANGGFLGDANNPMPRHQAMPQSYAPPEQREAPYSRLQAVQNEAAIQALQEDMRGAPKKWNEGPGIMPGYSMDTLSMTANQRQKYMPQGSTLTDPTASANASRAESEARREEAQLQQRQMDEEAAQKQARGDSRLFNPSYGQRG